MSDVRLEQRPMCKGSKVGVTWSDDGDPCYYCNGTGWVQVPIPQCEPPRDMTVDCPECDGTGYKTKE